VAQINGPLKLMSHPVTEPPCVRVMLRKLIGHDVFENQLTVIFSYFSSSLVFLFSVI